MTIEPGVCSKTLAAAIIPDKIYGITLPVDSTTPITYNIPCNSIFKYICLEAEYVTNDNYSIKLSNFEELNVTTDSTNYIPYLRGCVKQGFHRIYLKYTGIGDGIGSITISKNRTLDNAILYSGWKPSDHNDYFGGNVINSGATKIKLRTGNVHNYIYFINNSALEEDEKYKFVLSLEDHITSNPPLPTENPYTSMCSDELFSIKINSCGSVNDSSYYINELDIYAYCEMESSPGVEGCIFYIDLQINPV
jgi:hypothetical protein